MAIASGSYTIGGSSPNYATIALWEDDLATTLTGIVYGKIRAGDYSETITFGGVTATASNYPVLTYDDATGAGHGGDLRAGVQMRGPSNNSSDAHTITLSQPFTRVKGLNFNRWHGVSAEAIRVADGGTAQSVWVEDCLFWGNSGVNADGIFWNCTNASSILYSSNNFFGWLGRSAILVQGDNSGTIYSYNNTAVQMNCGNQNINATPTKGYPAIGDDIGDGPDTNGITWQIKNTYAHSTASPQGAGDTNFSYYKNPSSSWGSSTNNSASDTTAPGTNPQNSAAPSSQFLNIGSETDVGENTGNAISGTTQDAYINSGSTGTNYGTDNLEFDNSPINNWLLQIDLSNVSDTYRVLGGYVGVTKSNTTTTNQNGGFYRLLRDWVESEVTYASYASGSSWTTAGALGSGDIETNSIDGGTGARKSWAFENEANWVAQDEWFTLSGGRFVEWVQDAIDGNAPGSNVNAFDVITRLNAGSTETICYSSEDTDGKRPEVLFWYDTADDPVSFLPDSAGVLDGNGTDLSSDGYPVSVDIMGKTRSAWDIGSYEAGTALRASQVFAEVFVEKTAAVEVSQLFGEVFYLPTQGEDELGSASVSLALTTNTPVAYRDVWRTASGALVLTTATPLPALTIERTASESLAITTSVTPSREINREAVVSLGLDFKTPNEGFDVKDLISSWTNPGDLGDWYEGPDYGTYHDVARGGYTVYPDGLLHNEVVYDSEYPKQVNLWPAGVATITANDAVAPDGTTTADKVEDDSAVVRESKGTTEINVPNNAWVLHTGALKKQTAVTNNVYFEHGSYGGPFPGMCIDPVTGEYTISGQEWATVVDHPMDPDNWWFFASMYINNSGSDRSIGTFISPAFNESDPVDSSNDVTATGICHVWNVGISVIDAQADRPWGGTRAGVRINVLDTGSAAGGGMHHYGVWADFPSTYNGPIKVEADIRGSVNENGIRIIRELSGVNQWGTVDDVVSKVVGTGQWQKLRVILPAVAANTTGFQVRAGIYTDTPAAVGNFCVLDNVYISKATVSEVEHAALASETLALTTSVTPSRELESTAAVALEGQIGSTPLQYKGGDGTDDSWWLDNENNWSVNAGVFRLNASGTTENSFIWRKFIPIDRLTDVVEWGMDARMISGTVPTGLYCALREYTTNVNHPYGGNVNLSINPQYVSIFTGTETTLTADLDDTDTFCTVASTSGWDVDGVDYLGLQYYIENDQSDLPNLNVIWLDRADNIVSGSNINFHTAYSGATIPSGTKVRMSASGGTYSYAFTNPSAGFDTSWQTMYNRVTQPFEDITGGFSTTWAADGQNAMFPSAYPGRNPPTSETTMGWRPTTTHIGVTIFTAGTDATTVLEIDNIYIKTTGGLYSEVLHSSAGSETLALTTSAAPLTIRGGVAAVDLALTNLAAAALDIQRTASVDLTATVPASGGQPVMFLYPISDITVTNFEDEGAGTTDIFNSLNEGEPGSAADYIQTTSGAGGTYECTLTSKGDPTASDYHYILFGFEKAAVGDTMSVRATLLEGAVQRAQWIYNNIAQGETQVQELLSGAEADSLTAYGDLRMRWEIIGGTF